MKPLKSDLAPAVESLGAALAEAGIRINTRDCQPMSDGAGRAIAQAERKLRERYRGRKTVAAK